MRTRVRLIPRLQPACLVVSAIMCLVSEGALAANLNIVGGDLIGASGVDVGGTIYDVEFRNGTCSELFDGCDDAGDFSFSNQNDAHTAAQALLSEVFVTSVLDFDGDPERTFGCGSIARCTAIVPYARDAPNNNELQYVAAQNDVLERDDLAFAYQGNMYWLAADPGISDSRNSGEWNWVVFTPAIVPQPSSALLLGIVELTRFRRHSAAGF